MLLKILFHLFISTISENAVWELHSIIGAVSHSGNTHIPFFRCRRCCLWIEKGGSGYVYHFSCTKWQCVFPAPVSRRPPIIIGYSQPQPRADGPSGLHQDLRRTAFPCFNPIKGFVWYAFQEENKLLLTRKMGRETLYGMGVRRSLLKKNHVRSSDDMMQDCNAWREITASSNFHRWVWQGWRSAAGNVSDDQIIRRSLWILFLRHGDLRHCIW